MSDAKLTVDYLIIGAGATGMAFADVLVTDSNSTIAIVDRNDAPGGHWTISYPFVRLHGSSRYYGVISRPMPSDNDGGNRASRNEILDYYGRVMRDTFLASDRVTFLPRHDVDVAVPGQSTVLARSLVTGATTEITVRKRVVDASYMNITVPAMGRFGYGVDDGAAFVPVNKLVDLGGSPDRFTVVGAGKTGIDACLWLLERGVDPGKITWIVPRDAWLINRDLGEEVSDITPLLAVLKECRSADEVIGALEQMTFVMRCNPDLAPGAFRCATVNTQELAQLRRIEHVVRLGRVRRIGTTSVLLDGGTIESPPGTVHIDCTADGLTQQPLKPVFDGGAITLQPVLSCLLPVSGAIAAKAECLDTDDEARNRLCKPVLNPSTSRDLVPFFANRMDRLLEWYREPELFEWFAGSRFASCMGGLEQIKEPEVQADVAFLASHLEELFKTGAPAAG
jgi:hypothetical protein